MQDRFKFRIPEFTDKGTFTEFQYVELGDEIWGTLCGYNGEPQQCTGLKNKNGKLIYEGDIVDKGSRCKWIITWFKNRFILVPDFEYKNKDKCANDRECGFKYFENNHSYADKDVEVIGNIYENPELLEN